MRARTCKSSCFYITYITNITKNRREFMAAPDSSPLPLPEIPDEAAYQRLRERTRTEYGHLSNDDAVFATSVDLCRFGNEAYAEADIEQVYRINYCFRRLEEDWAAYVAGAPTEGVA